MPRVLARGDDIVPISGPKWMRYLAAAGDRTLDRARPERLETAAPGDRTLDRARPERLETAVAVDGVAGELYPGHAMRAVGRCGSLR